MENKELQAALEFELPSRIKSKIQAVLEEQPAYAADELVELAEEILNQISAVAVVHYLHQPHQKEVYNDFLIQLFNSSGHDYNAGPIYRWAANMIRENEPFRHSARGAFFWEHVNGKDELCSRVHHLAELRNAVMHGFFVLPPERNRAEAEYLGALLLDLHSAGFFQVDGNFHFYSQQSFMGRWNITHHLEWAAFPANTRFSQVSQRIVAEQSELFWENERKMVENNPHLPPSEEICSWVEQNTSGAMACWLHPTASEQPMLYSNIASWLLSQPQILTLVYRINEEGLSYSGSFLMDRLLTLLDPEKKVKTKDKKPEEWLPLLRKRNRQKVVVVVDGIHRALFSPQHFSKIIPILHQNEIMVIGFGQHHRALDRYFNSKIMVGTPEKNILPSWEDVKWNLHNYLRFKGPSLEKMDEQESAQLLEKLLKEMLETLENQGKIVARHFADEKKAPIEYIHELMEVLAPWIPLTREKFEPDVLDETYGFPETMTEVTPIFLALGRRDLKLEYTHKVLQR